MSIRRALALMGDEMAVALHSCPGRSQRFMAHRLDFYMQPLYHCRLDLLKAR